MEEHRPQVPAGALQLARDRIALTDLRIRGAVVVERDDPRGLLDRARLIAGFDGAVDRVAVLGENDPRGSAPVVDEEMQPELIVPDLGLAGRPACDEAGGGGERERALGFEREGGDASGA
ncbi:hypothetical protein OM076_29915 [Solirubrobacter ginsenosidimutans]|uniref:Uncharacterized protein n=1 Tax=Solirubrobacter ginsenosidimutans TaxID=490573 RepID=A0A9X3N035_9ACTN|nr:hypothetical protein [Solirubrobacter ginsenosidimutans]MDA0164525.1 hypothetical protein [Solirubrobacter ginsenosidimutans]